MIKIAAEKKRSGLSQGVRGDCWIEPSPGRYFVLDGLLALIEHIVHCTLRELPEFENNFYTQSSWKAGGENVAAKLLADAVKRRRMLKDALRH